MIKRNTIQKDIIYNTVVMLKGHVTADEVYDTIKKQYPNISRGTVYRNLKILSEEAKIRRIEIPNGSDRFDFTTDEHYHIRCIKCDKVMDVDMDSITDLKTLIKNSNGMKVLSYDILFSGICPDCQNKT